ncbi:MAG TPA: phenylalanine--tRNA ligase subunit beta [Candidatus Saccharimonadales bacterium]|jgi:phenylalanyl-tRNA synthetase beta chain|nr:phenylalanine--tRNA ligase subunit beta [Candidatus Saccharimonadales bacterium]
MKVSLNWLKEFADINLPVGDLTQKITTQLGAVEQVTDLGKQYEGIIIAKVIDSQPHPNADKLHICKIDDGNKIQTIERDDNGYIQVVCGASNVRKDLLSVFLPPGTVVPDTAAHDPLTVEVREIRGEKSHGMLASYRELAISNDHNGIVELSPEDGKPGDNFADTFKLNDHIIDLENKMFTHRPDCFGHLGIAREIAGICHQPFSSPEWYAQPAQLSAEKDAELPLAVENQLPELVPRFMAVALTVKENGPSPIWLQSYLSRVGIRPVNTIVDITNYMMLVSAQPLHAYDYDKLKSQDGDKAGVASLIVRSPKSEEKITALNGKTYTPRESAIGIASATKLVGIGGVIGGAETEVDNSTKHIVLECANFDMYSIRRTAMENGIFTDAVVRYAKGQSPLQNSRVLNETIIMLGRLVEAKVSSKIIDLASPGVPLEADTMHPPLTITIEAVKRLLGLELGEADIVSLLKNVEFKVIKEGDNNIRVTAPFWRTDIEIAEDVIEEIGRLWSYDALPLVLPKRDLKPAMVDPLLDTKSTIRKLLSAAGANELLTYSFVHGKLMEKIGQDSGRAYQLQNALSPELQYYRLSLLPSLLEKVYPNIRAGHKEFAIFEINPVHTTSQTDSETNLPVENQRLGLVFAADNKFAKDNYRGAAYYQAKKYLEYLFDAYRLKATFEKFPSDCADFGVFSDASAVFEPTRSAVIRVDDAITGLVGEFKSSARMNLKLPKFIAGFEIDILALSKIQARQTAYQTLSRFPSVQQDICLRVAFAVAYSDLYSVITKTLADNPDDSLWYEVLPVDIYQAESNKDTKQITFHITIGSYQRTLTDSVAESLLGDITAAAASACGAAQV